MSAHDLEIFEDIKRFWVRGVANCDRNEVAYFQVLWLIRRLHETQQELLK